MNNRERNWYEGKHGSHLPNCTCVECVERRLKGLGAKPRYEVVQPRSWEREVKSLESKIRKRKQMKVAVVKSIIATIIVMLCISVGLSFLGVEPLAGWKDLVITRLYEGWANVWSANTEPPGDTTEVPPQDVGVGENQEVAELVYNLVNDERVEFGIKPLERDEQLEELAVEHSTNMALNDCLGHERYGWRDFSFGMFSGTTRGENLVLIPTRRCIPGRLLESDEVAEWAIESWLDSPGHKTNMFTSFSYTGVGVYAVEDYYYITQIFEGQTPYAVPDFSQ